MVSRAILGYFILGISREQAYEGARKWKWKRKRKEQEHTSTWPRSFGCTIPLQCHRLEGLVCIGNVVCVDRLQRLWDRQGAVHGLGFDGAGPLLRGAAAYICVGFVQEGHVGIVRGHGSC